MSDNNIYTSTYTCNRKVPGYLLHECWKLDPEDNFVFAQPGLILYLEAVIWAGQGHRPTPGEPGAGSWARGRPPVLFGICRAGH